MGCAHPCHPDGLVDTPEAEISTKPVDDGDGWKPVAFQAAGTKSRLSVDGKCGREAEAMGAMQPWGLTRRPDPSDTLEFRKYSLRLGFKTA
jgi:hypothetical protein